ncbi:thiolase family protein [Prauserella cavernicola]|uniref:Probable acetyl-CoA acetyltransferase n=1 Tax=Prauserella cavernicola TaxID=2800127 RepID=A0A934QWD4_9PSEU|nr:thiolase family protein [Prauserella cavernicola]MBK1787830.1 thiolase family protein [Prauserella cavernicola]
MTAAYVLGGLRTPYGRYNGALAGYDTMALAGTSLRALRERHPGVSDADGALFAMVMQAGHGPNPARTALYRSGLGAEIPATTLNNACLAGVDSVVDATRRVERDEGHLYLVGGFDSSSRAAQVAPPGEQPRSALEHDSLLDHISGLSMAELSDRRNTALDIAREEQDAWAVESHLRASRADLASTGELAPLPRWSDPASGPEQDVLATDEGIRPNSDPDKLASLTPLFEGGTITAGNASQISDGAAVGLVGTLAAAERHSLRPLARIAGWGYSAGPTSSLHEQPGNATRDLLKRTGLDVADIDLFEINEAFAGVVIHACRELGISADRVNPNGGAIALGHPYGGTGFRLVLTCALELRRRGLRRGVATLCGGGGQGIAVLLDQDL